MDAAVYRQMAETQATHWWFVARCDVLRATLNGLQPRTHPRILEVGCGTGANLRMLSSLGPASAMERDDYAIEVARSAAVADVRKGWLPDRIPFGRDERFDVICLFDVLEHVEDDMAALRALAPLLTAGGKVVIAVPAYAWLFGPHDRALHHFRRYTARELRRKADAAGFRVLRAGYFNTLLLPLIVAARLLARYGGVAVGDETKVPGSITNRILRHIFALERHVVAYVGFPFGASVLAVIEKRD